MRKATIAAMFLLALVLVPLPARAQIGVSVGVNVALPPPIVFPAAPEVVVIPDTNVYVVPDAEADIFFNGGWWWRPWQGRWYRSRQYDGGWAYYRSAPPPFYRNVPPGWRNDYRDHRWKGREWNHERISHAEMERNWRGWERDRHWQRHDRGGAQGGPRPFGPGREQRMERRPGGPGQMRGPEPAFQGQPPRGRGFQPGPQGPRGGGRTGGPNQGPGPGRGNDHGGRGRR
jgi:hypothetical protein